MYIEINKKLDKIFLKKNLIMPLNILLLLKKIDKKFTN